MYPAYLSAERCSSNVCFIYKKCVVNYHNFDLDALLLLAEFRGITGKIVNLKDCVIIALDLLNLQWFRNLYRTEFIVAVLISLIKVSSLHFEILHQ